MDHLNGLNDVAPYAWTGGAGILGRAMFHAKQVQAGKRKPLSWALLLDLPIALGMGWSVYGVSVWRDLPLELTVSLSIVASYLGPYIVDRIFNRIADKYLPEPAKPVDASRPADMTVPGALPADMQALLDRLDDLPSAPGAPAPATLFKDEI